jgi:DNA-binding NarL/FixJ family response regulator
MLARAGRTGRCFAKPLERLRVEAGVAEEGLGLNECYRVLLCDDLQQIRLLLRTEMSLEPDIEVVGEAADGAEAIRLAGEAQPDVVILDLTMPVMDGLEALPRIREVAPGARVIVLSAHETEEMGPRAEAAGASLYLEKSVSTQEIVEAVRGPR